MKRLASQTIINPRKLGTLVVVLAFVFFAFALSCALQPGSALADSANSNSSASAESSDAAALTTQEKTENTQDAASSSSAAATQTDTTAQDKQGTQNSSSSSQPAQTEQQTQSSQSAVSTQSTSPDDSPSKSAESSNAAFKTKVIDRATLQDDWSGEYDGYSGSVVVRRTIHILIEQVGEDGSVVGTAIIGPSERAANQYGVNGSYKIYGTLDFETGKISMQGRTWLEYPSYSETGKTVANFQFIKLNGTLNQKTGTIEGESDNGIWSMHAVDYSAFNVDSGFAIARDSNHFMHTLASFLDENATDEQKTNIYNPGDELYRSLIAKAQSAGERSMFEYRIHDPWGGACFGIAATMASVFNGKFSANDLASGDAANYYALPKPVQEERFRNAIMYYQVSQYLTAYSEANEKCALAFKNSGLENLQYVSASYASSPYFLEMLVNAGASGKTYLFGYTYQGGGHAIVVTGCAYDASAKQYVVKAFDENTYRSDAENGRFIDIRVARDFTSFSFTDANGHNMNENSFFSLMLIDTDTLIDLAYAASAPSGSNDEALVDNQIGDDVKQTTTFLTVPVGVDFKVTNAAGQTLQCKGGVLSGDMPVHSLMPLINDENSRLRIQTDDSDKFSFVEFGNGFTVDMYDNDRYLATDTDGLDSVEMSFDTGVIVKGKGNAKVTTSTPDGGTVSSIFYVDGDAVIVMEGGNLTINYTQVINNINVVNYVEGDRYVKEYNEMDNTTKQVIVYMADLPSNGADTTAQQPAQQANTTNVSNSTNATKKNDEPGALDELIQPTRSYIDKRK